MTTELSRPVVIGVTAVASLAVGSVGGYFFAKKTLSKKFREEAEQEIAEAKRVYKMMYKKDPVYETPEALARELNVEPEDDGELRIFDDTVEQMRADATQALKIYSPEPEKVAPLPMEAPDIPAQRTTVFDGGDMSGTRPFNYDEEIPRRNPHAPYVISEDEYFTGEKDYRQVTVEYYSGDKVLAEEDDMLNFRQVLGHEDNLQWGWGSTDSRTVYIRNDRLMIDYEVKRIDGKYSIIVAGMDEGSQVMEQMEQLRSGTNNAPARSRFSHYNPGGVVGAGDYER